MTSSVGERMAGNGVVNGFQGGRPPDAMVAVEAVGSLERPGSPVPQAVQPLQKRGRGLDEPMLVDDNLGVEGAEGVSCKSRSITDLDVEVREEDVRIGGSSTLPEIQFSSRVHDQVDAQLATAVVIRLLGKSIGYRALLNRVQALWNPKGDMCLIDLDNDYYIARFALEEDFQKVLSDGPWVIYGSYLTVQPWSRCFSTAEAHPSHIMVWVRLPKLPYRYYTKSMFRYIAAAIGKVVRVDYNTTEGKRGRFTRLAIIVDLTKPLVSGIVIDGSRQDIEYEGLLEICYKFGKFCHSKEKCGTENSEAMLKQALVEHRDPRGGGVERTEVGDWVSPMGQGEGAVGGARLVSSGGRGRVQINSAPSSPMEQMFGGGLEVAGGEEVVQQKDKAVEVVPEPLSKELPRRPEKVVAQGVVVNVKSSLVPSKHSIVQVGAVGEGSNLRPEKGRVLPSSVRGPSKLSSGKKWSGITVTQKLGVKQSKKDDRGHVNPAVHSSLASLLTELDRADVAVKARASGEFSLVPFCLGFMVKIIFWNVQGALDPVVLRSFRLLNRAKTPDIVAVFEPRISGGAADRFIRRSNFEFSYRVEAQGFSGGIWILWRDTVRMDFLAVFNQFVHGHCSPLNGEPGFFVTFIYASPEVGRRRALWGQLRALEPGPGVPWVLGGDLNVIGSTCEMSGGHLGGQVFAPVLLMARIKGIECTLEAGQNPYLEELEKELKIELDNVLAQEESLWHQRARSAWIDKGDRNTKFFHLSAVSHKKRNSIKFLQIGDQWCEDQLCLREHAIDFFKKLFTSECQDVCHSGIEGEFSRLTECKGAILSRNVTMDEVHRVVFSMEPLKAPGIDGLHAAFYQKNWSLVGPSVLRFVENFFETGQLEDWVNCTLLVLIPKVEVPSSIKQFRPISLCTVLYKIITKILVERLKPFLSRWVSETQASFIPGRHITDNIIIAQEVMHSMAMKKGRLAWMAIKVDLEKAFCGMDRSLTLFDLRERLTFGIEGIVRTGGWRPIRLGRDGPPLFHLFFADDMVLFAEATHDQVQIIQVVLAQFCRLSGHKTSIADEFGFEAISDLGMYLGVPLLHTRGEVFIACGKNNSAWLPKGIRESIERLIRRFEWGYAHEKSNIALVPWETLQKPLADGGLGFKDVYQQNRAFLMKIGFQMVTMTECLWVRVMRAKYKVEGTVPFTLNRTRGSRLWTGLCSIWEDFKDNICWNIRNGQNVDFWYDCWLVSSPSTMDLVRARFCLEELGFTVAWVSEERVLLTLRFSAPCFSLSKSSRSVVDFSGFASPLPLLLTLGCSLGSRSVEMGAFFPAMLDFPSVLAFFLLFTFARSLGIPVGFFGRQRMSVWLRRSACASPPEIPPPPAFASQLGLRLCGCFLWACLSIPVLGFGLSTRAYGLLVPISL
ncbi:hypothetical protein GQ457_17G005590 [Hibiscus cannabinus]